MNKGVAWGGARKNAQIEVPIRRHMGLKRPCVGYWMARLLRSQLALSGVQELLHKANRATYNLMP